MQLICATSWRSIGAAQEQTEVVAGRGHHGINAVAFASFEVIAAHPIMPARVGELAPFPWLGA